MVKENRALWVCDVLGLEKPAEETREEASKAAETHLQVVGACCLAKTNFALSRNTSVTQGISSDTETHLCFKSGT